MFIPVSGRWMWCGLCFTVFFLTWSPSPAHAATAFVLWVTDGDTLTVMNWDCGQNQIQSRPGTGGRVNGRTGAGDGGRKSGRKAVSWHEVY
jgi:hypothetical protein